MYQQYDLSKRLYDVFVENQVPQFADGTYNRQAFEADFSAMSVSGKIDLVIRTLNNFEIMDTFITPITIVDTMPTQEEIWADGEFQESNRLTHATDGEYYKRTLTIPAKDYSFEVKLSKEEVMRAITQQKMPNGSRRFSNMTSIDIMLDTLVRSYQRKLRQLALQALFANPTSEDPTLPVLYRDTTGFASENQVVPPRNGLLTFDTAEAQEHHIWSNGVTTDLPSKLRQLIVDKGGDPAYITLIANEKTWRKYTALFTTDEWQNFYFQRELGVEGLTVSPLTDTINLKVPNSDMPDDYWLCVDISKKILKRRVVDTEATGLSEVSVDFNTLSKIMEMRGENEPTPQAIAMADNALETAIINGAFKVTINKTGYGVINCGMGAVAYTATGATGYVEPTWNV
jgi:hypothetical protein